MVYSKRFKLSNNNVYLDVKRVIQNLDNFNQIWAVSDNFGNIYVHRQLKVRRNAYLSTYKRFRNIFLSPVTSVTFFTAIHVNILLLWSWCINGVYWKFKMKSNNVSFDAKSVAQGLNNFNLLWALFWTISSNKLLLRLKAS